MARRNRNADQLGMLDIGSAKTDYAIGKRHGRQQRIRPGIPSSGSGADYHYRDESGWVWQQEVAWDLYRNHLCIGSIVDRAVEYMHQDGFQYDPNTGDKKVDQDLRDWWDEEAYEPEFCDIAGEDTFFDQAEQTLRSTFVAGDLLALPADDMFGYGLIKLLEGSMCRSPSRRTKENIVHGVELEAQTRKRLNYWLLDEPINPFETVLKRNVSPTPAYYYDEITKRNERNVFHVRFPTRVNQTRGITAFAPLFVVAEYLDDIEFLELVHKRAASLFAWIRTRSAQFDPKYLAAELSLGKDVTADKAKDEVESAYRQFREVAPGTELVGLPGETIDMKSANIPNPEHFAHVKMLLTYLGINLGMPLVMVLMDASETNFSGIRGAVDMARNGFRRKQRRLMTRFYCPALRWKLIKYAERDRVIRRWVEKSLEADSDEGMAAYEPQTTKEGEEIKRAPRRFNIFRHWWNAPGWPYIEPSKDAAATLVRETSMQTSPRRARNEQGLEWSTIVEETAQDRGTAIRRAIREATSINKEFTLEGADVVRWRDIIPLPLPERVTVQLRDNVDQSEDPKTAPDDGKKGPKTFPIPGPTS